MFAYLIIKVFKLTICFSLLHIEISLFILMSKLSFDALIFYFLFFIIKSWSFKWVTR